MVLPNFLIIGAVKAGTTSIAQYLAQHPQLFMSPVKEPFFFSFENQKLNFSGPGDGQALRLCVTSLECYEQLFETVRDEIAIGEASTSYLYTPNAARAIHKYIPKVKLIAILRNPVDTAYSSFLHQIREGFEPEHDFQKALEQEVRRIQENWLYFWAYRQNGFYYKNIKTYYNLFSREQIGVFLYSDFKQDPQQFMKHLFNFLDIDPSFQPDCSTQFNASGIPRNRILYNLATQSHIAKKLLRIITPKRIRQQFRQASLRKPKLKHDVRQKLMTEYRQDILQLQNLIRKDLSHWLI